MTETVTLHHRRHRAHGAQGHAGHPRGRAARHPDPAVLRPPAARPGRCLPAVHRRGRGPAQAARRRARRPSPTAWSSRPSSPRRSPRRRSAASWSCCSSTTRSTARSATRAASARCRTRRCRNGHGESRASRDEKRTFPKPIAISSQVLLDRERCVLCARCTRFSQQIAGDPFIELFERGALQQVGDLRRRAVRLLLLRQHRADLPGRRADRRAPTASAPGPSTWCRRRASASTARPAARSAPTTGAARCCAASPVRRPAGQRGVELRQGPVGVPVRHRQATASRTPLVRDDDGYARRGVVARGAGRAAARPGRAHRGKAGVLTGGRLTVEDAYAYAKFARVALGTNDIDFRARPHSAEERDFLAARVAGRYLDDDLRRPRGGPAVLLVGFEPEEESPIVFLRLRKAVVQHQQQVFSVAPFATPGSAKLSARCSPPCRAPRPQVLRRPREPQRRSRRQRRPRRRGAAPAGRGDPRRRAAGHRRPARCRAAAQLARSTGAKLGLGAAPRGRTRRARGRLPARPAAGRPAARPTPPRASR